MAFIAGTPIFTNSGWKNIEDISGHDKVLVRNFLGEAEFIQPFALKKKQYNGDVLTFGVEKWNITVTPEHIIEYIFSPNGIIKGAVKRDLAKNIEYKEKNKILRSFKFTGGNNSTVILKIKDEDNKTITISYKDWSILLAYMLIFGRIRRNNSRDYLEFNVKHEYVDNLCMIFNKYNINYTNNDDKVLVSKKNNLTAKFINALSSRNRKNMFIADRLIFNMPILYRKIFIEHLIKFGMHNENGKNKWFMVTSNRKFIDSMVLFCNLSGYSIYCKKTASAGDVLVDKITKKDVYKLNLQLPKKSVILTESSVSKYDGYVYEIDLFDGQIYTKGGPAPVWLSPK